jgi:hypothetical protein
MSFKNNQLTSYTRHLLGAFAASHPQISTINQEQNIALAQMSLLLEVRAVAEDKFSWLGADFAWLTLENVTMAMVTIVMAILSQRYNGFGSYLTNSYI